MGKIGLTTNENSDRTVQEGTELDGAFEALKRKQRLDALKGRLLKRTPKPIEEIEVVEIMIDKELDIMFGG